MAVHAEAPTCGDAVVVDHPQGPEAHPGGVVMVGKTEAVPTVEPVVLAVEAFGGGPQQQLGPAGEAWGGWGRGAGRTVAHGLVA